ncbi:MAG: hypothetical protein QM753_17840 [Thermomicrobiales bacterium]
MRQVRIGAVVVVTLLLSLSAMGASALAQATPESSPGMSGMPVAIHQGTCENPVAEPAWKVNDAAAISSDDTVGGSTASSVSEASDTIKAKLDDLGKEPYVIAVHASATDYGTIVACGAIRGPKVDGKLVVALEAVNGSGVTGIATFDEDKSGVLNLGSDEIAITVYLVGVGGSMATPAS